MPVHAVLPLSHLPCTLFFTSSPPQIRKSEKNLLERLFTVIHHLTPTQMEQLLREEEEIVAKRKEARAALEDCKTAVFVVGGAQHQPPAAIT
jgi:hypothetical protein